MRRTVWLVSLVAIFFIAAIFQELKHAAVEARGAVLDEPRVEGPTPEVRGSAASSPEASAALGGANNAHNSVVFYLRPYLTDTVCATDQSGNLGRAFLAAPAGVELRLPSGCILIGQTLAADSRWLHGEGRSGALTELRYGGASGPAIKLIGDGARVSDVFLTNLDSSKRAVSGSSAVGIQLSDGRVNPRGQMVDHVRIVGFRDQIDVQSGEFWSASYLELSNATRYGVRIRNGVNPDSGDGVIGFSTIYADNPIGETAIRLESGGGLKVVGTKALQFNRSFDLAVTDGANTSILLIDGSNSFENPRSGEAVRLGRIEGGTTGLYGNINLEAQLTGAVGVYPGVENVRLAPISRSVPYGVIVAGGDTVNITAGATFKNVDQAVTIQDPATNVRLGDYLCTGCRVRIEDRRKTLAAPIALSEARPISLPAPNASRVYVPLYEIAIPAYRGLRIGVQVEGTLTGVGVVNSVADVLASHNGSKVGVVRPVAAQVDGGAAPIEILYDTTTTLGSVRIGARVPPRYADGAFMGSMTLRLTGRIASFKPL